MIDPLSRPMAFYMLGQYPTLPHWWQRGIYFVTCFVRLMYQSTKYCWFMTRLATAKTNPSRAKVSKDVG